MNDLSIRIQNVLIPQRVFSTFQRHVLWEIDTDVEVMMIGVRRDYKGGKKVNRIIIPDQ